MDASEVVPHPEDWFDDLDRLRLSDIERKALVHLLAVLHTCNVISQRMSERIGRVTKTGTDIMTMISLHYFTLSMHVAEAVYNLCIKGYGPAALMLSRTILECEIDFAYLWLCKAIHGSDAERYAWLEWDVVETDKIHRMFQMEQHRREKYGISPLPIEFVTPYEKIQTFTEAVKSKYGNRDDWATLGNILDRAIAVDKTGRFRTLTKVDDLMLEGYYNLSYRLTSQLVHATSSGSKRFTKIEGDHLLVDVRPTGDLNDAAGRASHYMTHIALLTNHLLHTGVDFTGQLEASGLMKES